MAARKSKTPRHLQGARQPAEPKRLTDDDVNAAVDVIRADYYQDVRDCAEDFTERFEKGEFADEEAFRQQLHEYVDGSARVIYTWQARLGLLVSNNSDAYSEEMGEIPVEGGQINYSAMMFMAYEQDILANIGDLDFDS